MNITFSEKRVSYFDGSAGTFYCRGIVVPNENIAITIMMNAEPKIHTVM